MILIFALATAFPVPDRVETVQGWQLYRSANGICGIEGEVQGREFFVARSPDIPDQYAIGIGGLTWQSIDVGARYPLEVSVNKRPVARGGKGRQGFMGYKFVYTLVLGTVFEQAAARKREFSFALEGHEIGRTVFGSRAVAALKRCGAGAADPFASDRPRDLTAGSSASSSG
jgi:hypothetical protein